MIRRVHFRFGETGAEKPLVFDSGPITIFVGPNNSGKSLVLRELERYAREGGTHIGMILDGLELSVTTQQEFDSLFETIKISPSNLQESSPPENHTLVGGINPSTGSEFKNTVHEPTLLSQFGNLFEDQKTGSSNWRHYNAAYLFQSFVTFFTVALDGVARLTLTNARKGGDTLKPPNNHLMALFQDPVARLKVRDIVHKAFGWYLVIDPTDQGNLRIRLSKRAPENESEEQALDAKARAFHSAATEITNLSDGVKAFTGIVAALTCSNFRIMLVDEPEAFLYPPLAQELGRWMATLASERGGNIFTSTHSSRFLMGCIESGKPTNVIRLTYSEPQATARLLSPERLKELMQDPLLRSTPILDALFYSGAVVCEGDSDRVFYSEINKRLLEVERHYVQDSIFLNGYGKQTLKRIVSPLREMNIPAAVIVDIDIIKKDDLKNLLASCYVPTAIIQSLGQLRGQVNSYLEATGLKMKNGGRSLLRDGEKESCESLLEQLALWGIFVVPDGAVESWLNKFQVSVGNKQEWLPKIFDKMGNDPDNTGYERPGDNDVWAFIEQIAKWIKNENRKGMPF